jgi:hypothetical protein
MILLNRSDVGLVLKLLTRVDIGDVAPIEQASPPAGRIVGYMCTTKPAYPNVLRMTLTVGPARTT